MKTATCTTWCKKKLHDEEPGEECCQAGIADIEHVDGHMPVRICYSDTDVTLMVSLDDHLFSLPQLQTLRRELDRAERTLLGAVA
jgi:hypothetical protein